MIKNFLPLFICLFYLSVANAGFITVAPEYEDRYEKILSQLRCLVCQNQTVAESPAGLADDFRLEVKEMLERGASDDEILTFMSDRYGDFVLYKPPVITRTYLLWVGPFVFLFGGILLVVILVKKRSQAEPITELSDQDKQRLKSLLDEDNK